MGRYFNGAYSVRTGSRPRTTPPSMESIGAILIHECGQILVPETDPADSFKKLWPETCPNCLELTTKVQVATPTNMTDQPTPARKFEYAERDDAHLEVSARQYDSREAVLAAILADSPDAKIAFLDPADRRGILGFHGPRDGENVWRKMETGSYHQASGLGLLADAACAAYDTGADFIIVQGGLIESMQQSARMSYDCAEVVDGNPEYLHRSFSSPDDAVAAVRARLGDAARILYVDHDDQRGEVRLLTEGNKGSLKGAYDTSTALKPDDDLDRTIRLLGRFARSLHADFLVGPAGLAAHQIITTRTPEVRARHGAASEAVLSKTVPSTDAYTLPEEQVSSGVTASL